MPSTAAAAPLRRQAPKTGWLRTPGAPCGKTPIITRIPAIYDAPKSEKAPGSIGRSWGKTDAAYPGKDVISGSPDIVNCFTLQPKWSEAEPGFGFDPNSNLVEEQPVFSFFGPLSDPRLPILMVNDNLRNSKFKVTLKNLNEDFYNQHEIYLGSFPVVFVNQGNSLNGNRLRLSHPATEVEVKINPAISPLNFTLLDSIAIISKENGEEKHLSDCSLPVAIWSTKTVNVDLVQVTDAGYGYPQLFAGERIERQRNDADYIWSQAGIKFEYSATATSAPSGIFDNNTLKLPLNQPAANFLDDYYISGHVLVIFINKIDASDTLGLTIGKEFSPGILSSILNIFALAGKYDGKVIFVTPDADSTTMAHEMGHYIGDMFKFTTPELSHPSVSDYDEDNVMVSDSPTRTVSILLHQALQLRSKISP